MPLSREIHLVRRPEGRLAEADFALVERQVPDAADGQVLVENLYMSVDPVMRLRLNGEQPLDAAIAGIALGRVAQSRRPDFAAGDLVTHRLGFREWLVSDGAELTRLDPDPDLPLSVHLHALGATGLTAYAGLLHVARLAAGERVFVSGAAGAVGSVAAQIARLKGCHVVGSAGSSDKVRWLRDEAGLDVAINYKAEPIGPALAAATPDGLDVCFDNVGGDHLEAAIARMNLGGRIAICGFVSGYDSGRAPVSNVSDIIYSRASLLGFAWSDFMHLQADFQRDMRAWLKAGEIRCRETVREGIAAAPGALIGVLAGDNAGKMLVRLAA